MKHPEQYAEQALRREVEKVKNGLPGTRNSVLFRSALKTWKYGDVLGAQVVFDALASAGVSCGLSEQESILTIKKAWKTARY